MFQPAAGAMMIDLHGLSVKQTKKILLEQFKLIEEQNISEFYIITGRGNHVNANGTRGVLKRILPKLLKPYADHIVETDAGLGVYRVKLKNKSKRPDMKALFDSLLGEEVFDSYLESLPRKLQKNDVNALVSFACMNIHSDDAKAQAKALECVERAKSLGSLDAYLLLGDFYYRQLRYKKAFSHFKYAAEKGDLEGMHLLARCYLLGQGVRRGDVKGVHWLTKAADAGHAWAQTNLGCSYYRGDYSEPSVELAVKYLQMAVKQGISQAMVYLARCYAGGDGVGQSFENAFKLYLKAAQSNDVYALYQVGQYILEGRNGKPPSPENAYPWFLKAAELNDSDAQLKVGLILIFKEKEHIPEALDWLEKSMARNNKMAFYAMGVFYLEGNVVGKDEAKGYEYIDKSAKQGWPYAEFELAVILLTGSLGVQQNIAEGLQWLAEILQEKKLHASHFLGFCAASLFTYVAENSKNFDHNKLFAEVYFARAMLYLFDYQVKERGMLYLQHAINAGSEFAEKFLSGEFFQKKPEKPASLQTKSSLFQMETTKDCLVKAKNFYAEKNYKEAIKLYYKILSDGNIQEQASILCNLGHCYYALQSHAMAIKCYTDSIENKVSTAAYQWRAKSYRKQAAQVENAKSQVNLVALAEQDEQFVLSNSRAAVIKA